MVTFCTRRRLAAFWQAATATRSSRLTALACVKGRGRLADHPANAPAAVYGLHNDLEHPDIRGRGATQESPLGLLNSRAKAHFGADRHQLAEDSGKWLSEISNRRSNHGYRNGSSCGVSFRTQVFEAARA